MHIKIVNLIKLNLIYKKRKIRVKLNKYEFNLIKFLIKINLIKFVKKNNKNYDIFFNYINNKPIFRNIKNISKPSRSVFITNKKLKYISNKHKTLFLLNTNKGILTNLEAINMKIGGLIILKL